MDFPSDFYHFLKGHTLVEIKAGEKREKFTEIWIVTVGNRAFARSWNNSMTGWFGEILVSKAGQIKYGDKVVNIKAHKVNKEDPIHHQINNAYIDKYHQEENIFYANGIIKPEYADFTIELFYDAN